MKGLEAFERLARAARQEPVPQLDVTARVMHSVGRIEEPQAIDLPLMVFSVFSVVAASVMLMLAMNAWWPADPVSDLVQLTTVMLQ